MHTAPTGIVASQSSSAPLLPRTGLAYQITKSMATSLVVPLVCYIAVAGFAYWGAHLAPFAKSTSAAAQ
jgi:fucose permease